MTGVAPHIRRNKTNRKFVINLFLLLSIGLMLLWSIATQAQDHFPREKEKFIRELESFFNKISVKEQRKEAESTLEEFTLMWMADSIDDGMKNVIYDMTNQMADRRLKAHPHFYHYLYSIVSFAYSDQSQGSINAWINTLDSLVQIRRTSRYVTNYLQTSYLLFRDNTLYESRAVKWQVDHGDFKFGLDTVPYIIFPLVDLKCYAHEDSSVVYNTRGIFYPMDDLWRGEEGKIDWLRAGFDTSMVYAELSRYEVEVKFYRFSSESVKFYHKKYFKQPLMGNLEEKILANVTQERASYPKFYSYFTHLRIDSLFEDIDYEGGIAMEGSKMLGLGNEETDAYLSFKKNNREFVRLHSDNFVIRKDRISSSSSSVTIFFENDSIYHPGLQMKYLDEKRELSLIRTQEGLSQSPFFNSFHEVDMYCEAIYWNMNESNINFEMIRGISGLGRATFESANYFSAQRYYKLQGIDRVNPLMLLRNYIDIYGLNEVYVSGLSEYMRKPREQIIHMLIRLAKMGFLVYELEEEKAIVKDRLFDYLDAFNKKIDYDVIRFNSETQGHKNAALDLDSFDLKLYGVPIVFLSDSQRVYIFPNDQELTVKKNRDFVFSGRVHAGLFDFYASNCTFRYNQFKLDMPQIDSMSFMVPSFTKNEYNESPLVRVKTVISDLTGELLIDEPNNKSGLKDFPHYPVFSSKEDAYVYYDKNSIHKGVYSRDKFYFYVYPFTIDSLDNFKTDVLQFQGYLASSGIFPDIEESLSVQPDYSLGFVSSTPPEGYALYGGKGTYFSEVKLSHEGLRGSGSLEYLTSTSWSDDFLFFPDSCNAVARNFLVREQLGAVEYPAVSGVQVQEHWMPYEDRMIVAMTDFPLNMYNEQSELYGAVALTPNIMTGSGMMKFEAAEMDADLFKFAHHEFESDTADFRLLSLDKSQLAFSTEDYSAHIDLEKRKGEFKSNGGTSIANFPINQYICTMDQFDWFMDDEVIAMGSEELAKKMAQYNDLTIRELMDVNLSGSEFISTHPEQDSLRFFSTKARYSLKDNIIEAEDVKYIRVADAAVFPSDKKVTIRKEAVMKTFAKARILANTVTKYHDLYDATVNIQSRKYYTANGEYDYVDETGYKQKIHMHKVTVDTTSQTYAFGRVSDSLGFTLSNDFDYAGKVKLLANNEFLYYDGGFRIRHTCNPGKRSWVKFRSEIDPKEIYIPIGDSISSSEGEQLYSSLMFSNEVNRFYSAFLNEKRNPSDQEVLKADGFLRFDKIAEDYEIGSKDKLQRNTIYGNHIALDRRHCVLRGEGQMDFGVDFGLVDMGYYGKVEHHIIPDTTSFDMVLTLNFPFVDKAMSVMTDNIVGKNLTGVELDRQTFLKAITDILGPKDAEKLITDINLYNRIRRWPSELEYNMFFSDVKMRWNYATRSYESIGPIGIGAIDKKQINKYVDGYIQIEKKRTGDELNIYLEFDDGNFWYFFNYRNNLLQALSSNEEFNIILREMKPDKRTVKGEKGQPDYKFIISNLRKKTDFVRRMR